MKKLIQGIVDFRLNMRESVRETFAQLALGQSPDVLFIACSDSRVVPNLFASTNPGDLFVIRNVGNIVPPADGAGRSTSDEAEPAAIEFALMNLDVRNIVVCGHSECGAMGALIRDRTKLSAPNLKNWLRHGEKALEELKFGRLVTSGLSEQNQLSQLNVLQQLRNLRTYPLVDQRIRSGKLQIQGWWFDIAGADVYAYNDTSERFELIDENSAPRLLASLDY